MTKLKGRYHNEESAEAQSARSSPIYGAVVSLEARTLDILSEATSPDDAAELIKERRLEIVDLGEHWHALHWLFARRADSDADVPLTWAVLGRTILRQLDRGRGPPGLVAPRDASRVATALAELHPKTARLRFDPEDMDRAGIAPGRWTTEPLCKPHDLLEHLKPLTTLYRHAAKAHAGTVGFRY